MKYLDFRPTFVEPIWMNTKQKEIALLFLKSLAYNKYNINQYLPQFHVFYVALNITAKSLINQTQISAIFTLFFFLKSARFIFKESYFSWKPIKRLLKYRKLKN